MTRKKDSNRKQKNVAHISFEFLSLFLQNHISDGEIFPSIELKSEIKKMQNQLKFVFEFWSLFFQNSDQTKNKLKR